MKCTTGCFVGLYILSTLHILACGGRLNGSSGHFTSPNYPSNYSVLTRCEWTVTAPDNNTIAFTFLDLRTEAGHDVIVVSGSNTL